MITTRSRCCFSLSSNKQLRHTPQDSRSQTTREMNTTRAYNTHDPNQPQSSTIFLMTSFNDTIIITSTVSHQRRLRSIISRSKVSVVRSRSPPFWISSRKHFTSNILFRSIPYQYPRASRCIPNSFIYLSLDIFDTFRKNVRDVAYVNDVSCDVSYFIYFTHWKHDAHIFLLHNEWRSKHMYLLNITIICSYCGDAMKEMNRGIRSFFLFTIYTIQLWNRVRFCFFKSFTERRRCHTNNTYIQRINIYTLLTQNHSDVRLEGHLIFRDFIEFERKKEETYKKIDVIK